MRDLDANTSYWVPYDLVPSPHDGGYDQEFPKKTIYYNNEGLRLGFIDYQHAGRGGGSVFFSTSPYQET